MLATTKAGGDSERIKAKKPTARTDPTQNN